MCASSGRCGTRDERIELPAVMTSVQARQLVEQAMERRWRTGDRLRISLPPSRLDFRPGNAIQLAGSDRARVIHSVSIEGMAVLVEAEASPIAMPTLPADPGRAVSEPDVPIGRTELILFELPETVDGAGTLIQTYVAAANDGGWKPVPIELSLGSDPLVTVAATRRAVIGRADTLLYPRVPLILDELSTVDVKLSNPADILLNCDADALMAGANMALLGDELIQFGRAEHLGAGIYRLLRLLRGRRGTEWAAATHAIGEHFCLIDPAAVRPVDILASAAGVLLTATAHGVGDVPPLPSAQRLVSGESLRPVSPCHLKVLRESTALHLQWTRRSHRGWGWVDSVGDADDPFAELYRLTIAGPAGQMTVECATSSASVSLAELPAGPGQMVTLSVATVGPMVPSRAASTTFMI
jgi:hypothetical protein